MKISNKRKLKDLQKDFNKTFPYLRLMFFSKKHGFGNASEESDGLDSELTVAQVRKFAATGYMPLHGHQKVGDFEQLFFKTFGLNVQVYRKSYGKWLQTWATDMWTLDEQNNRGRVMGDRAISATAE